MRAWKVALIAVIALVFGIACRDAIGAIVAGVLAVIGISGTATRKPSAADRQLEADNRAVDSATGSMDSVVEEGGDVVREGAGLVESTENLIREARKELERGNSGKGLENKGT